MTQALALNKAATIPGISAEKQQDVGDQNHLDGAELAQEIGVSERHSEALPVTMTGIDTWNFLRRLTPSF